MREPPQHPWYHRFLNHLPKLSDQAFALMLLGCVLLIGMATGMVLCMAGYVR